MDLDDLRKKIDEVDAKIVELLNVGGNANNGAQCGLAYANSNNAFSNSNTNIGARLKLYTKNIHCLSLQIS